jgi:hypothetical protein
MPRLTLLPIATLVTFIHILPGAQPAQSQGSIQAGKVCRVTDPTGTPLNARLRPNGKVINRIRNGRSVFIQSVASDDEGKPWVLVAIKNQGNYKILGYVLREFVSCY